MKIFIILMLMCLAFGLYEVQMELREIKHMVNEVVCVALEMEE
jgi:hypothetical protein